MSHPTPPALPTGGAAAALSPASSPLLPKSAVDDLTLFSRRAPLFPSFIPVGRPNMGDKAAFMARMEGIWESRMLANQGPCVREFEAEVASFLGVRHFISMCNGTVALEIAARALGMSGEVIVPSFTFVATAHCLMWQEITPVFCDIDPRTHLLDPAKVEALITPRTTGIIGVHLWGQPCDCAALQRIADKHGLRLMYDAAHAFGCAGRDGVRVGNNGDCEVFSFHATKFFNTFEGGGVATNDAALAEDIRRRANFGFIGYDNVVCVGTNGKMTEPCAALGLVNLKSVPAFIATNRANYELYAEAVGTIPGIQLYRYDTSGGEVVNFQYIVLEVDEAAFGLSRDCIVALLTCENISARRYFFPGAHRMMPYRAYYPHAGLLLPETVKLCGRIICLPTGTGISAEQILAAGSLLRFCQANAEEIQRRVSKLPYPLPIGPGQLPPPDEGGESKGGQGK
jgi:dTDP-4-amino-4,6-dideoxygalactose transaminase